MQMQTTKQVLILAGLATAVVLAADRFDHVVRNDFFIGFSGDAVALDRAMKVTEATLAENPKHAEALVWHGAGLLYRSGALFQQQDFQTAVPMFERAVKEMDQAVEIAPNHIGVRIPRGAALMVAARNISDPSRARPLFERAASDFQTAYDVQSAHLDELGDHPKSELLMGLADTYYRLGEENQARTYFEKLLAMGKASGHEAEAKEWLATKKLAGKVKCVGCHVR
jgi:tetratricopeptide (TPR) repeat protein